MNQLSYYCFEENRVHSFAGWSVTFLDLRTLAAAGFYYTGKSDIVKCFECGIEISQWMEGDKPMTEHQRFSAFCRFIRKIPCGNVPIGVCPSMIPKPEPRGRDVCGLYGLEYRPTSTPDCFCNCHLRKWKEKEKRNDKEGRNRAPLWSSRKRSLIIKN